MVLSNSKNTEITRECIFMGMKNHLLFLFFVLACGKEPVPGPIPPTTFSNSFVYDSLELDNRFDSIPILSTNGLQVYEASGVVPATFGDDLVWIINDSGNPSELFLVSQSTGKTITILELDSVTNIDWEDIASYQDTLGHNYLYIADIGDNYGSRATAKVYKFLEPNLSDIDTTLSQQSYTPSGLEIISFTYEGGPRDAEALIIHPQSGAIFIINKRTLRNGIYRVNQDSAKAFFLGDLTMYLCTAGDAKIIDGDHIEVIARNYDRLLLWEGALGESIGSIMSKTPKLLPYTHSETQGESIWFTSENGFGTASEYKNGVESRIAVYKRY